MKKLKNLSLHRLGQAEMTKKEMNTLTGGGGLCGCWYPAIVHADVDMLEHRRS